MSQGRYGDWRTVSKYSARTNFIGTCHHPDGCNFRVRTETECGSVSPWSDVANSNQQNNSPTNTSMVRTLASTTECGVIIQWDRAPAQGSRPMSLQVWIQQRNGEFSSRGISQFCSNEPDTTQCTVPSDILRAAPFFLTTGDSVVAKVTVQYNSWKVTYETDDAGYDVAELGSKPGKVDGVLAEKVLSNSSIDVSWNAPNNQNGLQYELVWNNGIGERNNAQYTPLTQPYTFALRYNRGSLVPGRNYLFKVRAINACGAGDWSDVAVQSIHQSPQQPARPTVNAQVQSEKCGVEISWPKVQNGGSEITGFYIMIESPTGYNPTAYEGNVDTSQCTYDVLNERKCFIQCTTLHSDFGIAIDGNVVAQVTAENSVGKSSWSAKSTDTVQVTLPPNQMAKPRRISTSGDSITITWAALSEADTNGNAVSSYKIAY